jgi:hypothetical protein
MPHGDRKFVVRSAKLFKRHVSEREIKLIDTDGAYELLDVMTHRAFLCDYSRQPCPSAYSSSAPRLLEEPETLARRP